MDSYNNPNEKDFIEEYLGKDYLELTNERISEAIKKLKIELEKIPFGMLFTGPYYVRDYITHQAIVKNEPLFLKDGYVMWTKVDSRLSLWDYVKNPYIDPELTTVLSAKDGKEIYSINELKNILQIS